MLHLLAALLLYAGTGTVDLAAERDALAKTELAFAANAVEKGVKEAFLAYLADDSVIFRPGAVPGKAWFRDHPSPPIVLTWRPALVEVSRAADLGYDTGPYELRGTGKDAGEVGHGDFVTVWRKQADGAWKAVLDLGSSGGRGPALPGALAGRTVEHGRIAGTPLPRSGAGGKDALFGADRALAKAVAERGAAAYESALAPEVRVFRRGAVPAVGKEAARALLGREEKSTWEPAGGGVARSEDLGYTYGTTVAGSGRGNYLRIWERDAGGAWRVVLDLLSPLP